PVLALREWARSERDQKPVFRRASIDALLADARDSPTKSAKQKGSTSMVSRAERSAVAGWWWTVDHWLLAAIAALIVLGLVLVMAGSPPVADRLHLPPFQFVNKQVEFLIPSLVLMIGISFATPRQVRRLALLGYIAAMALIFAALAFGHE